MTYLWCRTTLRGSGTLDLLNDQGMRYQRLTTFRSLDGVSTSSRELNPDHVEIHEMATVLIQGDVHWYGGENLTVWTGQFDA